MEDNDYIDVMVEQVGEGLRGGYSYKSLNYQNESKNSHVEVGVFEGL